MRKLPIHKPTTKQLSYSVIALKSVIKLHLIGKGKSYESLLHELIKYDYFDDEIGLPSTIKEVYEKLGINNAKYRKWLEQIYNELLDLIQEPTVLQYPKYKCVLSVSGHYKTYAHIETILTYIPRVGENIELPFLKAKLETNNFFVNSIKHEFTDEQHEIILFLKPGSFNAFKKMKEEEEKHINFYGWMKKEQEK